MQRIVKFTAAALALTGALGAAVVLNPFVQRASAQDDTLADTITVTGNGSAVGTPDIASIEFGVEIVNTDLGAAYRQANEQIDSIVAALGEAGIAAEDIQTTNFYAYAQDIMTDMGMSTMEVAPAVTGTEEAPMPAAPAREYRVGNNVRVTVRDINNIEAVIDAAVNAGANNIYGLTFDIENRDALEQEARVAALENARARAQQYADALGVELGDVVFVSETGGNFIPYGGGFGRSAMESADASVQTGTLEVSVSTTVTFRIVR